MNKQFVIVGITLTRSYKKLCYLPFAYGMDTFIKLSIQARFYKMSTTAYFADAFVFFDIRFASTGDYT
jgi:hypothetical protein